MHFCQVCGKDMKFSGNRGICTSCLQNQDYANKLNDQLQWEQRKAIFEQRKAILQQQKLAAVQIQEAEHRMQLAEEERNNCRIKENYKAISSLPEELEKKIPQIKTTRDISRVIVHASHVLNSINHNDWYELLETYPDSAKAVYLDLRQILRQEIIEWWEIRRQIEPRPDLMLKKLANSLVYNDLSTVRIVFLTLPEETEEQNSKLEKAAGLRLQLVNKIQELNSTLNEKINQKKAIEEKLTKLNEENEKEIDTDALTEKYEIELKKLDVFDVLIYLFMSMIFIFPIFILIKKIYMNLISEDSLYFYIDKKIDKEIAMIDAKLEQEIKDASSELELAELFVEKTEKDVADLQDKINNLDHEVLKIEAKIQEIINQKLKGRIDEELRAITNS